MKFFSTYNRTKLILTSLVGSLLIIYPNIVGLPWDLGYLEGEARARHINFFFFRYIFFAILIFILTNANLYKITTLTFGSRFLYNLVVSAAAYGIYSAISYSTCTKADCFGSILIFQFMVTCFLCSFLGHMYHMNKIQRKKELEIERLKSENLQSRCDALTNQINPHFFFNSLNSITALVRKKNDNDTLAFVNKLSDVFRYILQSEKKGIVTLQEELEFLSSFQYMMEVRFANKLQFNIDIGEEHRKLKIPTLSFLPLIDNIVTHNIIDSEHKIDVSIRMNDKGELQVSNPIHPKITPSETNGIGLKNLDNRFSLLMNKKIKVVNEDSVFTVFLPLK